MNIKMMLLPLALLAAPAAAVSYDAFTSFDGTQGAGNFYYGSFDGSFTLFTACSGAQFDFCLGNINAPLFGKTSTASQTGTGINPNDRLFTHPGASSAALVAFRAPVAGNYRIDTLFSVQDVQRFNSGNGVGITAYFQPMGGASQPVPRFVLGTPSHSLSIEQGLAVGDIYGLVIDNNGSPNFDSTGVNFTVTSLAAAVPEPATWGLMVAGFGLAGTALRRRQGLPTIAAAASRRAA